MPTAIPIRIRSASNRLPHRRRRGLGGCDSIASAIGGAGGSAGGGAIIEGGAAGWLSGFDTHLPSLLVEESSLLKRRLLGIRRGRGHQPCGGFVERHGGLHRRLPKTPRFSGNAQDARCTELYRQLGWSCLVLSVFPGVAVLRGESVGS